MPAPLLETKLYLPKPRAHLVPRPRLHERLEAGAAGKLLLLSAPAGFGKTTLLADWLAASTGRRAVAWVSLDRGDNDPGLFWTYVVAAIHTAAPGVGVEELALLANPQTPPIRAVLTSLFNDLASGVDDVLLVLDDYHLVDEVEVQEAMAFLLEHAPQQLHLVIAGRADPALPLARLRSRGELVELRAADLRFTLKETAEYLNEVMGLQLTVADLTSLEERTEGWVAALQLAALSMQGRDDPAGFIAGFSGDDRYVVDYLLEEVLQRQPPEVRDFLLQTSLLSRLSGSLCDEVTATTGGRSMLEALDRSNLFLVPLDDRRQWYRFHHLFADVLRARLVDDSPALVPMLHARASGWFAEHHQPSEAIEHALAGDDVDRAADLIELALPAMSRNRQESVLRGWVERLPEELLTVRPVLSNGYAGALMSTGEFDGVDRHLRLAEHWLNLRESAADTPEMVVASDEGLRLLPAGVAVHRAGLALATGDPDATVVHAGRALGLLGDEDQLGQAAATALIGLATWTGGDLASAREGYATSLRHMERAGHLADMMGLSLALADIQVTQGELRGAMRTFERALALRPEQGGPALRGTADMYVGISELLREQDDLPAAHEVLARARALGEHNGLPQNPYRWRVAMARLREAEGDLDAAVGLLDEAERVYVGDFSPNVRPVAASRARAWIRQGQVATALAWARDVGLSVDDGLSYMREYEHLTLVRALLAGNRDLFDGALALLNRLLTAADSGGRTGTVIEILVLQSLAHRLRGDVPDALTPLARALELAEREGYVRVFLDEGSPMVDLLRAGARQGIARSYVERLVASAARRGDGTPTTQDLVDRLSERELDVLRLLGTELTGPEIAAELVVSLNTVRTHTKAVYAKLGVNNRRTAVRRGQELGLMSGRRPGSSGGRTQGVT